MNSCEVWPQPQAASVAVMLRSDMSGLLYRWSILSRTDLATIFHKAVNSKLGIGNFGLQ